MRPREPADSVWLARDRTEEVGPITAMHFTSETVVDGISERLFNLEDITGALWTRAGASGSRPLVLIGHGGGQHKKAPGVVARARHYITTCGFAAAAIDAPGHGDRQHDAEHQERVERVRERIAAGETPGDLWPAFNAEVAARTIPDWRAVLDAVAKIDIVGDGPVGYFGISMGGNIGIRLAAAEPRITAAVFGLVRGDGLTEAAAAITIPVEFLLQWDDEAVPRDSALELFGRFGSADKTLHANPGGHGDVPRFEVESSARFFARHLTVAT